MDNSYIWTLATVLGPILIAGAFLYAFMRQRRLTLREKESQHQAVQELYEDTPQDRRIHGRKETTPVH